MYKIPEISKKYQISEPKIINYLTNNNIPIYKDNSFETKYFQVVLDFIEGQDDRLLKSIKRKGSSYYYDDKFISINQNDAISFLKQLPPNSIDIITTDPAYSGMNNMLMLGNGRIVGKYSDKGKSNGKWFNEFRDSSENYGIFLAECKRVLKRSTGHIYIMFDSFSLLSLGNIVRDYFDVKNLITWDKVNIGMGHYFRRRHEYIIFATNGNTRKIRNRKFPDIWRFKRVHNLKYPTQKPVEVFQTMIYASSESGFTVCDPFLGSASSAIAAIKNKCNFIGCDISEKSIEISSARISEYLKNGTDNLQHKSLAVEENVFWK